MKCKFCNGEIPECNKDLDGFCCVACSQAQDKGKRITRKVSWCMEGEIKRLWDEGRSVSEISKSTKFSETTIRKFLKGYPSKR